MCSVSNTANRAWLVASLYLTKGASSSWSVSCQHGQVAHFAYSVVRVLVTEVKQTGRWIHSTRKKEKESEQKIFSGKLLLFHLTTLQKQESI